MREKLSNSDRKAHIDALTRAIAILKASPVTSPALEDLRAELREQLGLVEG